MFGFMDGWMVSIHPKTHKDGCIGV